jgi:hypothetical protein
MLDDKGYNGLSYIACSHLSLKICFCMLRYRSNKKLVIILKGLAEFVPEKFYHAALCCFSDSTVWILETGYKTRNKASELKTIGLIHLYNVSVSKYRRFQQCARTHLDHPKHGDFFCPSIVTSQHAFTNYALDFHLGVWPDVRKRLRGSIPQTFALIT